MRNVTQNLFFHAILILFVGSIVWFFYTDQSNKIKFSILNHFTDLVIYVGLALFGTNVVLNFREILAVPYRALFFSSNVVAIATFIIAIYAMTFNFALFIFYTKLPPNLFHNTGRKWL